MVNYNDHRGGYKWHEGYFDMDRMPKVNRYRLNVAFYTFGVFFGIGHFNQVMKYLINNLPYWEHRVITN